MRRTLDTHLVDPLVKPQNGALTISMEGYDCAMKYQEPQIYLAGQMKMYVTNRQKQVILLLGW